MEPMRVWEDVHGHGFRVEMFDNPDRVFGKWKVPFKFRHKGRLIFESYVGASPLHSTDGAETLAAILTFCSLRPGDTDAEFFADYTPRQLAWCRRWGETLGMYAEDMGRHSP